MSQWQDLDANEQIIRHGLSPTDLPGWREQQYPWASACNFWSSRICGLACLESVLTFLGEPVPARYELICRAVQHGVYRANPHGGVDGLLYQPFCDWVKKDFGLDCLVAAPSSLSEILLSVGTSSMVMASVSSQIRDWPSTPTRRGGHLVLITGHDPEDVVFHNPSGVAGCASGVRMSRKEFDQFFASRGVVMTW